MRLSELLDSLNQPIDENNTITDHYVKLVEHAVDEWEEDVAPITKNFITRLDGIFKKIEAANLDAEAIKQLTERSLLSINAAEERMMAKLNGD